MRLLAHGGNEYAERRRIGPWPAIATGPLEDTYGLSGDLLSFGCGLLEKDLVLVIRQAQKQGQRLYAYSLVLDPGATLWERFHWNGASLVLALFGGLEPGESTPDCFGRQLLEHPEEIDEEKLVSVLEGLPVPPISPARDSDDLISLWVGAIYSSEPVTVAPQSLGMESRPGVAQVASTLQALPPSFRAGLGWLVGGSAIHSRPFGAHLVVDDWLTQNAPPVEEHIKNGDWFRSAWETLVQDPSLGPLMHEKLETPIWEWDEPWAKSPRETFARVGYLAEVLKASSPDDELINRIQGRLDEQGPLEREIRYAVHMLAVSNRSPLSQILTLFLLRNHFDKGVPVDGATAGRMDVPSVIEYYTSNSRRIKPTLESGSPPLRAEVRFEIWLRLASTEETAATIPELLGGACSDLRSDESLRPRIAEIVQASLTRSVALTNSLEMWIAYRRDKGLGPLIGERLREESLERAIAGEGKWLRDYLAFGQDSGGACLARPDVPALSVQMLVKETARLSESDDILRQDARNWLSDLALSPLRVKVPIKDKLALGERLPPGWENFQTMVTLYMGRNQASPRSVGLAAIERESLLAELKELTSTPFRDDFVPNLHGLNSFLGGLPGDVLSAFVALRPKFIGSDITGWLEGWEKLRPEDVYQDELIRSVMQSDKQFKITALLDRLNDEKRTELLSQLLFKDAILPDEKIVAKFKRFIENAVKDRELAETVAVAFKGCETDHSNRDVFFRRHCKETLFLDELLKCLDPESHQLVVSIILQRNSNWLVNKACLFYDMSLKPRFEFTLFRRAVLYFVLSPDGRVFREEIVKEQKLRNASYVEKHLKEVLGRSAARAAQRPQRNKPGIEDGETKPSKKGFWRKLFSG